jgi:hypothetical protein
MDRPEELQDMIDTFINIDSRQWERRMERTGHYTPKVWGRRYTPEEVTLWTSTR